MPYRDTWATCENCGNRFIDRVEDQREQAERGEQAAPGMLCRVCAPRGAPRVAQTARVPKPLAPKPLAPKPLAPKPPAAVGAGPHEGAVKWFSNQKGYGFIVHASGDELFFHSSGVVPGETLDFPDGTPVTYLIEETEKGPQAVDVARMDTSEPDGESDLS